MSASRIVFPDDTSDDELIEGDGSEQMKLNNRCDDGDKNVKERVCTHCNIAFNDATALQEHLYEIIAETMKKKNIYGTIRASIGKTRSKPSANVLNDSHKDSNSNRRSIISEKNISEDSSSKDSDSQDSDNENLDNKNEKLTKKSMFSVRDSNIKVMYECLICHARLPSNHFAQNHRRKEHPGLLGSRIFKTVYMKEYVPNVKHTKSNTAASKTKISREISINKIHIENMNLSDLPEAVKRRPKYKVQNTKDTTKKVTKTNNIENTKIDKISGNSKGLQKTNMERKRKSKDHDTSSGKVRRFTQDEKESCAQVLYRCNLCEVHFVSEKIASTHLESCRNGVTIEPVNCGKCGRPFQPKELVTHSVRDHRHSEVNFKIVNISPVLERQTPKGTPSEKKQEKAPKQDKVPLYKCQECDAHFVTSSGLRSHNQRHRHDMELIQCEICDFSFTTRSHNAHIIKHHDRLGLRRQDFEVVSREDIIVEEYAVIKRASPIKTNVRRDSAKHDQKIAQTDADKNKPIVAEPEAIPSTSSQNSTAPTLFKCVPCDVHFTEDSACLSHVKEHEPFDRLQFLKCPECELQYENNCFMRHRVVHRGEFDLEQVLVKAYMPCENSFDIPTVETYYAARKTATAIDNHEVRDGNTACKNLSIILQTEPAIRYKEIVKSFAGQIITEVQVHQANDSLNLGGEMILKSFIDKPASESITNVKTTSNNSVIVNNVNAREVNENENEICTKAQSLTSATDCILSAASAGVGSDNITIQASAEQRSVSIMRNSDININHVESISEAYYYGHENAVHLDQRETQSPNIEEAEKCDEMELRFEDTETEDINENNNEDRLVTEPVNYTVSGNAVVSETNDPAMVSNNSEMSREKFINANNRRYRLSVTVTSDSDFTEDEEVFRNCPTPVLETRREANAADLNRKMSYSSDNASDDNNPNHNNIINHENAKECHNTNESVSQGNPATEAMETDDNSPVTDNDNGEFVATVTSESQIEDESETHILSNEQSANDSVIIVLSDDDDDDDDDDVLFVSSEVH